MSTFRDLDAPEQVDSFGRSRGRPQRGRSTELRSLPYKRPDSAPSAPQTDKWQHDLFEGGSSLYNARLNKDAIAKLVSRPSPSLRPFGTLSHSFDGTETRNGSPAVQDPAQLQLDPRANPLLRRLDIKGSTRTSENTERKQREAERKARIERERKEEKARQVQQRKMLEERGKLEQKHKEQTIIAEHEDKGSVVQVEGLVHGTSAEDVQTAFSAYGETSFCFIVDEKAVGDLVARLTFKRFDDAVQACQKLNGAIADGKPLKVHQVQRTPYPAPLPPLPQDLKREAIAAAPSSRMYADEIEAVDPRASVVKSPTADEDVGMDVDMADAGSTLYANGQRGGARRGRGRHLGAGLRGGAVGDAGFGVQGAAPQGSMPQRPLAERFGASTAQPPTAPRSVSAPSGMPQKGSSLLSRLGGASAAPAPAPQPQRGGSAARGAKGSDLLSRMSR